jgi:hypothetical protein
MHRVDVESGGLMARELRHSSNAIFIWFRLLALGLVAFERMDIASLS